MSRPAGRVLVLLAHPALQRSRVNRRLVAAVDDLERVTVHDLYEAYPDLDIDVSREQELLSSHDVLVLQHPFYWYSTPAILKEWQDLVLEHGWAYGSEGTELAGKWVVNAVTAGGREVTYREDGLNAYSVRQLLAPIERTFALCKMQWLPPFVVHGTHSLGEAAFEEHASDYRRFVAALRDGTLDVEAVKDRPCVNEDLAAALLEEVDDAR